LTKTSLQSAWRQTALEYARQSSRPLAALAFVLPLLALYEVGVLVLGPQAVRNGADVWLRQMLDLLGFGQYFLLPALTVGVLLAWHYLAHDRWQVSAVTLYAMAAECTVLGLVLVGVARLEASMLETTLRPCQTSGAPAAMPWVLSARAAVVGRVLGFVGAGVYEEALFRLLLLPPLAVAAGRLGARRLTGVACGVIVTSLLFSTAHYVGPHGETFEPFGFSFRCTAGAFFALLFVCRGFGIAAGTHALYDIFISFG
jgi:membrane protease YdiL (CAAX protease family)